MNNITKTVELHEESIVDDEIIVVIETNKNEYDYDSIKCINYVQKKMICLLSILIVTTILLVFVSIII